MLEAALDVQALAVRAADLPQRQDVDGRADERRRDDERCAHVRRRDEALDRLDDDQHAEDEQGQPVRLGREDLGAAEAERHAALRRPERESRRPDADPERGRVDQHVGGVREERQRVGDDADARPPPP